MPDEDIKYEDLYDIPGDLYDDEEGGQRRHSTDRVLKQQLGDYTQQRAVELGDREVMLLEKWFDSKGGHPTEEEIKEMQPLLDEMNARVQHLPNTVEKMRGKQRYIDVLNWRGILYDEIMRKRKGLRGS